MKILHVTPAYIPSDCFGGAPIVVQELCTRLSKLGNNLTIVTSDAKNEKQRVSLLNEVTNDDIKVIRFKNISNTLAYKLKIFTPFKMRSYLKKTNIFDVVHIHDYRTLLTFWSANSAVNNKVPYVIQPHGTLQKKIGKKNIKKIYDVLLGAKIIKNASCCLALTEYEAEQFLELGANEQQISILPNGINIKSEIPQKGAFKAKYNIPRNDKIIMYLGRIHKIKGIDILIDAFNSFEARGMNNIWIVIAGPDDGHLRYLKNKASNNKKIIFTGPLKGLNKLELFRDSSVFVLPSHYDTFPITVLEAWSYEVPVIMSYNCGLSYEANEGSALVFRDKEQLIEKILLTLNNTKVTSKLVETASNKVKGYNWDDIATHLNDIYRSLI